MTSPLFIPIPLCGYLLWNHIALDAGCWHQKEEMKTPGLWPWPSFTPACSLSHCFDLVLSRMFQIGGGGIARCYQGAHGDGRWKRDWKILRSLSRCQRWRLWIRTSWVTSQHAVTTIIMKKYSVHRIMRCMCMCAYVYACKYMYFATSCKAQWLLLALC